MVAISFAPAPKQPTRPVVDPNDIARREALARELQDSSDGIQQIKSPWQGLAQLAGAAFGGYTDKKAADDRANNNQFLAEALGPAMQGNLPPEKLNQIMALDPKLGMQLVERQQEQAKAAEAKAQEDAQKQQVSAALRAMGATQEADAFDAGIIPAAKAYEMLIQGQQPPDAPTIAESYDPATGQPVKKQWNAQTQQWEDFGGVKAPADPLVQVNNGNSNKFGDEADKLAAGRMSEIVTSGQGAQSFMGDILTLSEIGKTLNTGKGAEVLLALGPYAEAMGIKMDGLGEAQAYEAIVSRMAPAMRIPGSGASSDFDARQFLKSLPALGNSPEGNAIMEQTFTAIQQGKIAASNIASQALSGQITWQEADKQIAAIGDPFTAFNDYRAKTKGTTENGGGWKEIAPGVRIRKKGE